MPAPHLLSLPVAGPLCPVPPNQTEVLKVTGKGRLCLQVLRLRGPFPGIQLRWVQNLYFCEPLLICLGWKDNC